MIAGPAAAWLVIGAHAMADVLPRGGVIAAGAGSISQAGSTLTIDQQSARLITNWDSFSVGQGATVNFRQPSVSAIALNRVLGSDPSVIQGALRSNGQVFLLNPNGILFTSTAQVNTGGFVASTLGLSNNDFLNGNYHFTGSSAAAIHNQGSLKASGGGAVALIAAQIVNDGVISAERGSALLGAGSDVVLDLGSSVGLTINKGALGALIDNGGAILANGGQVLLTAQAAASLPSTVINNTGLIEARTLAGGPSGSIKLLGGMASDGIAVGGTLDASAPNGGDGGGIETSAAQVYTLSGLKVTAEAPQGVGGTWLIDPFDYTINSTAASNIVTALNAGTSVTVSTATSNPSYGAVAGTNGDITVSSSIAKTTGGAANLTLRADRNIAVNAAITSTSGALGITLSSGNASSATVGGIDIAANLTSNGGQIVLAGGGGSSLANGYGYALNSTASTPAVTIGAFTISSGGGDITINGQTNQAGSGAYSGTQGGIYVLSNATIDSGGGNIYLNAINTAGVANKEFAFSAEANSGSTTTFKTATGSGAIYINAQNFSLDGGVGLTSTGSQARIQFYAPSVAGFFVTINGAVQVETFTPKPPCGSGSFLYCGTLIVPGSNGSYKYATYNSTTSAVQAIQIAVSSGNKTYDGATTVTGLGSVSTTGATPNFTTTYPVNSYTFSTSSKNVGTYYSLTNGAGDPASSYTESGTTYAIGYSYGAYKINQKALTATAGSKVYDGTTTETSLSSSGVISGDNVTFSGTGGFASVNVGTGINVNVTGITLGGTDAGNYSIGSSVSTTANITVRPVNLTGSRVYDSSTGFAAGAISLGNLVSGEALTLSGSGSVASKNVATGTTLSLGSLALGNGTGGLASNYTLIGGTDHADITKANLTISGLSAQNKVYDTLLADSLTGTASLAGKLGTDSVSLTGTATSGTFGDKNVGPGKLVTASLGGLGLSGNDSGNYQIAGVTLPLTLTADITATPTTLSFNPILIVTSLPGAVVNPGFSLITPPTGSVSGLNYYYTNVSNGQTTAAAGGKGTTNDVVAENGGQTSGDSADANGTAAAGRNIRVYGPTDVFIVRGGINIGGNQPLDSGVINSSQAIGSQPSS
jgi:filamentous hemagglutinin family protein